MAFDRLQPFNDIPDLPPKMELETHPVLKAAISANRALAELDYAVHLIPNPALLLQSLGLQEAKSSSEIENIVTTNDKLYLAFAESNPKIDPQTKEVLYYQEALWHGYDSLKNKNRLLTTPLFEELVRIICNNDEGVRKLPGTILKNPHGDIIYTPPQGESVIRNKLSNLEKFISTLQVFMGRSRLREPLRRNFISQDRLEYAFLRNKITSKGALSARGAHKNLQSRVYI